MTSGIFLAGPLFLCSFLDSLFVFSPPLFFFRLSPTPSCFGDLSALCRFWITKKTGAPLKLCFSLQAAPATDSALKFAPGTFSSLNSASPYRPVTKDEGLRSRLWTARASPLYSGGDSFSSPSPSGRFYQRVFSHIQCSLDPLNKNAHSTLADHLMLRFYPPPLADGVDFPRRYAQGGPAVVVPATGEGF